MEAQALKTARNATPLRSRNSLQSQQKVPDVAIGNRCRDRGKIGLPMVPPRCDNLGAFEPR